MLNCCVQMLRKDGVMLVSVPNLPRTINLLRIVRWGDNYRGLGCFEKSGTHGTSRRVLRRWFRACGLKDPSVHFVVPEHLRHYDVRSLAIARRFLAAELFAIATK